MKTSMLLLALLLAATAPAHADGRTSGGADAYRHAQDLRQKANQLMSGVPTLANVEKAAGYLNEVLDFLATPDVQERAAGDIFLYARKADVLRDLAAAYALMGRRDDALTALELMAQQSWSPAVAKWMREDERLASLQADPRFNAVVATMEAPDRFWKVPGIATPYKRKLTVEERVAGLSLFWAEARQGFAYFDHVPALEWDRVYLDYLRQVMSVETTLDYYRVMMKLAPLLHDGHTNIYPPRDLEDAFFAHPPVRTERIGGKVYVTAVRSKSLSARVHVGDEILAIDGTPVARYAQDVVDPYVSGSTPQERELRTYTFQLLQGDASKPVNLTLRDAANHEREESLPRTGYGILDVHYPALFQFRKIGDVAYLSLDHFESEAGVKAFEKALPDIMASKGLVLDLRHNAGGSTNFGMQILSYLVPDPLPRAKERIRGETAWFRTAGNGGSVLWVPAPGSGYAPSFDRAQRFQGPVAVLIGPQTYSAAEDFVMAFDAARRGTLVGSTTAGSTGQSLFFPLPGDGAARICIKRDSYPDGREFVGKGIAPNVEVSTTVEDLRAGRDPVLDRAVAELLEAR